MSSGGTRGQIQRPRWLRDVAGVVFVALAASVASLPATQPAFSYHSPFQAEQCERAIAFGERRLAREPTRARLIMAEGLLCRGEQGDAEALGAAIERLRAIADDEPGNFFVQMELADALRLRSPTADEALAAQRRAVSLLKRTDVGAARQELAAYVGENLAAMEIARRRLAAARARRSGGAPPGGSGSGGAAGQ